MAAHPHTPETTAGSGLLPLFAIAVLVATIAICAVVAAPTTLTLIIALSTVIGFATGLVMLLGRLIGPEDH